MQHGFWRCFKGRSQGFNAQGGVLCGLLWELKPRQSQIRRCGYFPAINHVRSFKSHREWHRGTWRFAFPSTKLGKLILNAADGWEAPLQDPAELEVEVKRGALLSGPQMVDNNELRKALIKRFPNGIAIEMEGEGKMITPTV